MESLPKQFVSAMRTLFDIMDDKQTGYVMLTDIENRWRDDRTKGLPHGVIESLQKVSSHDGFLTFESFCTGLKICLLRNQVQSSSKQISNEESDPSFHPQVSVQDKRPPSVPIMDINNPQRERNWTSIKTTASHRTHSMPHLAENKNLHEKSPLETAISKYDLLQSGHGPPKPPRLDKPSIEAVENTRIFSEAENIRDTKLDIPEISRMLDGQGRGLGDGRSASGSQSFLSRTTSRRREPRRHTLHNGIDYNLIKKMKQIEQEKDILLQGLSAVEEAREWYLKQLAEVQDKIRYTGRMGAYVEPWNEAQQERLELLRARILELNRQLGALASATGWRHWPLSLHMNLALPASIFNPPNSTPNNATVLRSQNRMLAEEVNRKNERISILEREKSALIRELLLQRNRTKIIDNFG
ncbi:suppressor APC domain-containing protein 2 [Pieris brassicae]|uniref:suppressor APC domain-containing protein 2 n=1 Tax=Pieris brassicae TaxID=7116 RepID=UPI001E66193F|nr:suppressor APC domain-containing protein 2 [Pieris brassicae]